MLLLLSFPCKKTSETTNNTSDGTIFGGVSFSKNPNAISALNYTFKIPVNPQVATNHAATPLGAIGVALNGVSSMPY